MIDIDNRMFAYSIGLLIGIPVIVFLLLTSGVVQYTSKYNGTHIGYITAIEQGLVPYLGFSNNRTTVYVKTSLESSQEDDYCIPSDNQILVEKAREFAKNKVNVEISYDTVQFARCNECSGNIITNIKILN